MSRREYSVSRPRPGPDWFVQDVRSYAYWREGVDACATCGGDVRLDDDHYGMELLRARPDTGKRAHERDRFVFCSTACVDTWHRA